MCNLTNINRTELCTSLLVIVISSQLMPVHNKVKLSARAQQATYTNGILITFNTQNIVLNLSKFLTKLKGVCTNFHHKFVG